MTTDNRIADAHQYLADDELTDDEARALDILLADDEPEDTDAIIRILSGKGE